MDGWMKALVAAACIAILAVVGYFFYGEAQQAAERAAHQDRVEEARRELFRLTIAKPHELQYVISYCESLASGGLRNKTAGQRQTIATCQLAGYL